MDEQDTTVRASWEFRPQDRNSLRGYPPFTRLISGNMELLGEDVAEVHDTIYGNL